MECRAGSASTEQPLARSTDPIPVEQSPRISSNPLRTAEHVLPYPDIVSLAGDAARFAWDEFFYGKLRNEHTRRAYRRAVDHFLGWCEGQGLELRQIAPRDVGLYLDSRPHSAGTKKVELAALRHFFDQLVTRHAVILNPAASVRGERLVVVEGKTPEITVEQARRLLASIKPLHAVALRDRAIIATLIYTAARIGAVARLRCGDFYDAGDQHCLRFTEKGGKSREIPVRHDLQRYLLEYLEAAGLADVERVRCRYSAPPSAGRSSSPTTA